jgi:4-hydroxy-3-methylbut-2-enyl diphosphate reductase
MIYYPKVFGTCTGSNKAIEIAFRLRNEFKDKNVYIYKEILHNPYIIDLLAKDNIKCIDDLNIVNKDDILIIRAHGETKETYEYLKKKGITYYDATCINVTKVHEIVEEKYNQNKNIIIIGKKTHPEVIGTNSYSNNKAIIIEDKNDYKNIDPNKEYFIVCQTTISEQNVNDLLEYLNKNNIKYEFKNTICNAQKIIQNSSLDLAKIVDVMFVIGGKSSSNTKELYELVKTKTTTYYFSNLVDFYNFVKKENYSNKMNFGFTGGASTPKEQIFEYAHLLEFVIYYKNKYNELKIEIDKYNNSLIKNENPIVMDAINKFIKMNNDGKFVRGCLIDLGYKLNNDDEHYSTPLSIAYETLETSILIHDDIIDNADTRRGKETIHKTYQQEFKDYKKDNTNSSLAICIGDLGIYYSSQIIVNSYKDNPNLAKLLSFYNEIVINTIKGKILDVYLPFIEKKDKNHILKEDDILEIYKLKTSYYTILGPFILGMILGNSNDRDIKIFEKILLNLGISFQIKDDILGIFGNDNIIGKSTSSDIEEFKQTILYSYVKTNKKEYLDKLLKYYGHKNKQKEVQKIFIDSGSLNYAPHKMNELFHNSKERIKELIIKENIKNILLGFITFLEIREK